MGESRQAARLLSERHLANGLSHFLNGRGQPLHMRGDQLAIPCVFMRGGTSRGAFILNEALPTQPDILERLILAMYGSPDPRQIDGIGGAHPLTSKVAVIGRSTRPDADVSYTFGQVRVAEPTVDFSGSCGNLLAGVGPYAIDEGLVEALAPVTRVRIHDTNTGKLITAEVPTDGVQARTEGDTEVAGVPGRGVRIMLDFAATGGSMTGGVLPTGNVRDQLEVEGGGTVTVSIVDVANPVVFVRAADVGLRGTESVDELERQTVISQLESLRAAAAARLGFVSDPRDAARRSPAVPKVYAVAAPSDYLTAGGDRISRSVVDVVGRGMVMQRPHKAYAATAGICTAVAARIPGTVVHEVSRRADDEDSRVRIGHPSGVMVVEVSVETSANKPILTRAALERTARRIMDGTIYVPLSKLSI